MQIEALHKIHAEREHAPETEAETQAPAPETVEAEGPVSIWLYIAGLLVTLSGLYAVNFGMEDSSFATLTYGLAISGYVTSYVMRTRQVSLRVLQAPLSAAIIFLLFATFNGDAGMNWLIPAGYGDDRAKSLQLVFAWLAIIHTFTLTADAAVLFACVPCMTMIALVSTTTTEPQIQNAFLLFICASIFLMVHENYLRTRTSRVQNSIPMAARRIFNGQVQLAAFCFFGALILANLVVVPIRTVGQRLFLPTGFNPLNSSNRRMEPASVANVSVNERDRVDIARGPMSENDTPLMRVRSERGLYWRGTTFDYYNGTGFENTHTEFSPVNIDDSPESESEDSYADFIQGGRGEQRVFTNRYRIPGSPFELPAGEMQGSKRVDQYFTIIGGHHTQVYGAGDITEVNAPIASLQINDARNLKSSDLLSVGTTYRVKSQVATDDPELLRAADSREIPQEIRETYLQTALRNGAENDALRAIARQITSGQSNSYDKAVAIRDYIAQNNKYNLQAPAAPADSDRVEYFLTGSKQGYCDSFGAAMTMLCRYAGIPARLVSGFITGDLDPNGFYVIKEKHKHIWTEVFFPKIGWVAFDATDGAEDISERGGKDKKAKSFLAWFFTNGWGPPLIACLIVGALLYIFKTELLDRLTGRTRAVGRMLDRPQTNIEIIRAYLETEFLLGRRGLGRSPAQTPDEFLRAFAGASAENLPGVVEPLDRLTQLYTRYRYGSEVATEEDVRLARTALAEIQQALAAAKSRRAVRPSPASA